MSAKFEHYVNWIRLVVAIHFGGNKICNGIFQQKFPQDGEKLYKLLFGKQKEINEKLQKKYITEADYKIIFPENKKTESNIFNIAIFTCLLEVLDSQYTPLCNSLRHFNETLMKSKGNVIYTKEEFQKEWNEVIIFLNKIGFDTSEIKDLKTYSFDGPSKYEKIFQGINLTEEEVRKIDENKCAIDGVQHEVSNIKDEFSNIKDEFSNIKDVIVKMKMEKDEKDSTNPKEDLSLELEYNSPLKCILSTSDKIEEDDVKAISIKKKKSNECEGDWEDLLKKDWNIEVKENITYLKINYKLSEHDFYDFKVQIKTGAHQWSYKNMKGIANCNFINRRENEILLIAYNHGKPNNIHLFHQGDVTIRKGRFKTKFEGANFEVSIPATNVENFRERCKEYHNTNEYVKRFPPKYKVTHESAKDIGNKFEEVLKDNYFVITGPQFMNQLELHNYSVDDLKEKLQLCCSEDERNNNLLIFDLTEHIILNIRITDSEDVKSIKRTMQVCNNDMKAFFMLHEETLSKTLASVIAVVACPKIQRRRLKEELDLFECEDIEAICDNLFLTFDDLIDEKALKHWLDKVLKRVQDESVFQQPNPDNVIQRLNQVIGETMAIKAVVYCGRVGNKELSFPVFSCGNNEVIRSLFLNREQFEAISKKDPHKIILGPFGSGKSIILKQIILVILEEFAGSEEKCKVFFVCCDPYSLLEARCEGDIEKMVRERAPKIKMKFLSITELAKEADVNDFRDHPEIIKRICDKSDVKVSFLLDEVSGEDITEEIAIKFRDGVCGHPNLNALVIAAQSIQKIRTVHREEKKTKIKINQFDKMGMTKIPLTKRMRMTRKIDTLMRIAEKCVEKLETKSKLLDTRTGHEEKSKSEETNLKRKKSPLPDTSRSFTEEAKESNVKKPSQLMPRKSDPDPELSILNNPAIDVKNPVDNPIPKTPVNYNPKKEFPAIDSIDVEMPPIQPTTDIPTIKNEKKQPEYERQQDGNFMDTDDIYSTLPSASDETSTFLKNETKFQGGKIGHGLEGASPRIYYLHDKFTIDSATSGTILSTVLKDISKDKRYKETTIVCSTKEEIWLTCFALERENIDYTPYFHYLLNRKLPSVKEKKEICEKMSGEGKKVLVTDYRGFRGCESEHCVVFVRRESTYKDHVLVEALARAIAFIDIFVLPDRDPTGGDSSKTARLSDILTEWKDAKDDDEKMIVDINEVHVIDEECIKIGKKRKDVSINKDIDDNDLYKKIKKKYHYYPNSQTEIDRQLAKRMGDQYTDRTSISALDIFPDKFAFRKFEYESNDFMKPAILGKVIGKGGENLNRSNDEFKVQLRVRKNLKKIRERGPISYKQDSTREKTSERV